MISSSVDDDGGAFHFVIKANSIHIPYNCNVQLLPQLDANFPVCCGSSCYYYYYCCSLLRLKSGF